MWKRSRCFQPEEGSSRGLLHDYEPLCGSSFEALIMMVRRMVSIDNWQDVTPSPPGHGPGPGLGSGRLRLGRPGPGGQAQSPGEAEAATPRVVR